MPDIILDTDILVDFLTQYYKEEVHKTKYFVPNDKLKNRLVREINNIIYSYEVGLASSVVVSSSFAFVEIARNFNEIPRIKFTIEQFAAFINQPPRWFFISDLNSDLFESLCKIPSDVFQVDGSRVPLEWADTIHVATAMSRDEPWLLATTDSRIKALLDLKDKII